MSMDNVGIEYMPFGDLKLHGHSDIFLLAVNQSHPRTSSIANHRFYRALGRLHGLWCKQHVITLIRVLTAVITQH